MLTLVGRSFGRTAGLFAAICIMLAVFEIALIAVAASFTGANDFARLSLLMSQLLPGFLQSAFGPAMLSFGAMTTICFFDPLVVMIAVQFAVFLATEPAGEIEGGLVDLVLARPLPRHWLISRSVLVMTAGAFLPTLAMGLATWLGLRMLAPAGAHGPEARVVLLMMIHLATLSWCFGGAALAAAAWSRRRAAALAAVALSSVALYLIDVIGESWARVLPLARLLPFHYYHGAAILRGTANPALDLSILSGIGVVGIALAYWQFGRRDL
jgi:hypothetical protein